MQHPDEGMIHAWLDGELSPEESAALEAHAAQCEQCTAAIAEARGLIAASSRIVSSLDAVPGGVIPAVKPAKRMWYSSAQFRAAAAVAVVAGASLLVMRSGSQKAGMPVATKPQAAVATTKIAPSQAVQAAAPRAQAAQRAVAEQDFSGKRVAGVPARGEAAKAAEPAPMVADAMSLRSATVAGAGVDLKVIRTDTTATAVRTVYQSLSGGQVILVEESPAALMSKAMAQTMERRVEASQSAPTASYLPAAPAVADTSPVAAYHSISWVDPVTRHRYSLSGRVTVEELEAIKARLLQEKR